MSDRQRGLGYLAVLFLVAIMGILMGVCATVWHTASLRQKENELLYVGNQFRRAIGLFYESTPSAVKRYPSSLEDLLHDPRQIVTQRYLRKIYVDPMTKS